MEAHQNHDSEEYFLARPGLVTMENQRVFEAGFNRGWKAGRADLAQSSQVPDCADYMPVKRSAIDWFKKHYPALCEKSGLCERIAGRLYTKTTLAAPTPPQSSLQPLGGWNSHDLDGLEPSLQVAQEWTDERILYRFAQLHMLHGGASPKESLTIEFARAILAGKPAAPIQGEKE